jgi:hypothetical protein
LLDAIAAAGYQAQGFIDVALLPTLAAYTKIFYVSDIRKFKVRRKRYRL